MSKNSQDLDLFRESRNYCAQDIQRHHFQDFVLNVCGSVFVRSFYQPAINPPVILGS